MTWWSFFSWVFVFEILFRKKQELISSDRRYNEIRGHCVTKECLVKQGGVNLFMVSFFCFVFFTAILTVFLIMKLGFYVSYHSSALKLPCANWTDFQLIIWIIIYQQIIGFELHFLQDIFCKLQMFNFKFFLIKTIPVYQSSFQAVLRL